MGRGYKCSNGGILTRNLNLAITSIWNYLQDNQLHKLNRNKINMQDAKRLFMCMKKSIFICQINKIKKYYFFGAFLCLGQNPNFIK